MASSGDAGNGSGGMGSWFTPEEPEPSASEPVSSRLAPVTYLAGFTPVKRGVVRFEEQEPAEGSVDDAVEEAAERASERESDRSFGLSSGRDSGSSARRNSGPGTGRVAGIGARREPRVDSQAGALDGEPEPAVTSTPAKASTPKRASNVSMNALARRGMSQWEMRSTLTSRDLDPDDIDAELERLEGVGLIDDAALAETIVRTQHDRKGLGRSALISELRRRHIDQEHIDAALEQLDGDDELSRARELAERRAPQLRSYDQATATRRLSAFLMRKGYSSSIVRDAVEHALGRAGGSGRGSVRFE